MVGSGGGLKCTSVVRFVPLCLCYLGEEICPMEATSLKWEIQRSGLHADLSLSTADWQACIERFLAEGAEGWGILGGSYGNISTDIYDTI